MEKMKAFNVETNYGGKRKWRIEPISKEKLQNFFGGESILNYYWDIFKSKLNEIILNDKGAIAFNIFHSDDENILTRHLLFTYGYSLKDARDVVDEIYHNDFKTNEYLKFEQDEQKREEEREKSKHEEEIEHKNEINDQSRPIKIIVNKLPKTKDECPFCVDGYCKLMENSLPSVSWDDSPGFYDSGPSLNSIDLHFDYDECILKDDEPGIKCPCLQASN